MATPQVDGPWSAAVMLTCTALAAALVASPLGLRGRETAPVTAVARGFGRLAFYGLTLALSLPWFAARIHFRAPPPPGFWLAAGPPFLVAAACVVAGLRRQDVDPLARGEAMLITGTVLALAAGLSLPGGQGAALVATLSLLFLGAGRIVRGSAVGRRQVFLEGLTVVLLAVAARLASSALEPAPRLGALLAAVAAATAAVVAFERRGRS